MTPNFADFNTKMLQLISGFESSILKEIMLDIHVEINHAVISIKEKISAYV